MQDLSLGQLQTLLIVLVVLILIVLGGLVFYITAANRAKSAKHRKAEPGVALPSPSQAAPTGQRAITLIRDSGGLQVELAGIRYRTLAEIQDPDLKRQVVVAAMDMIRFTGVLDQAAAGPIPIDRTYSWREDVRQGSQVELANIQEAGGATPLPRRGEIETQFLSLLAEMGQAPPPPAKPSLVTALERGLRPKAPEERPRTFVDDIEEIIQRRVQLIPAIQARELHVRAAPDGTVRFAFDSQEYEDATKIPNMTARQLIQDAIKEWEETS